MERPVDIDHIKRGFVRTWNVIKHDIFNGNMEESVQIVYGEDYSQISREQAIMCCWQKLADYGEFTHEQIMTLFEMSFDTVYDIAEQVFTKEIYDSETPL